MNFIIVFLNLFKSFRKTLRNPELRLLILITFTVIFIGVIFYHFQEKLSWVDSFYFTIITLATVGYGDITPQTEIGKIFTSLYVLVGIGILIVFIENIAKQAIKDIGNDKRITKKTAK